MTTLLRDGYGFSEHSRDVTFALEADGMEVGRGRGGGGGERYRVSQVSHSAASNKDSRVTWVAVNRREKCCHIMLLYNEHKSIDRISTCRWSPHGLVHPLVTFCQDTCVRLDVVEPAIDVEMFDELSQAELS